MKKFPNYLTESLSKVQRFHDPETITSGVGLSRSSSVESLDSLPTSNGTRREVIQSINTVRTKIKEDDTEQVKTLQLPSLITPVSLFGKKIRFEDRERAFFFFFEKKLMIYTWQIFCFRI